MARDSWFKAFKEAYIDLHAAYLAVLRLRHERKKSLELVIAKDMERKDPFGINNPAGAEAVERWKALWKKHETGDTATQALSAVTEALASHWKSWMAFMDLCPPDIGKFRIEMPYDAYMLTATQISRETLEKRAQAIQYAWKLQVKGGK